MIRHSDKQNAVVVSFDNVLPMQYEIDALTQSQPSEWSHSIVRSMHRRGFQIIILSSYPEAMRPTVEAWLQLNNVPFDKLLMCADMGDDSHNDAEDCAALRGILFDQHVRDYYCVLFAVEGNPVIAATVWAQRGIHCV